ncbi:MAG TPA: phosphate ABC transporter substrate-binding protein PstS [Micropepsaceae bacterium]|nr:phosphate ABC transporter substrate-binding protein PstS [Micropepsaceae bacterium]
MNLFNKFVAGAIALVAATGMTSAVLALDISGAGATLPFPIYSKWASAYKGVTGNSLNYQSIGSGGGIKQIESKTVTFGASDMPLSVQELNRYGLLQFPSVIGGVVPVVNVRGVAPGAMVLDGATLANIYLGKIPKWNDPAIKKLNPSLNLPDQVITTVHRSDGSGTVFIFTNYLSKVSPEWKDRVAFATAVEWPVGIGAKGNEGVAGNVAQTSGAIGFVEYAYAKQNKLAFTKRTTRDGKTVSPVAPSFGAAAAGANWDPANGFGTVLTDQPGVDSWPIAGATFVLVYKQPQDPAATKAALKFFQWAYQNGDSMADGLDYVAFPDAVKQRIMASWSQVQGWNGGR